MACALGLARRGACMAMEGAVCLGEMVSAHPGRIEAGLSAYAAQRALRTARVQLFSRAVGEHIYHPAGAHAALRNVIMAAKSQADWYDSLSWLYVGCELQGAANTPISL
ncbi:MAG: hypothetical protein H7345_06290 [Rubritepida sp.]|nr:hypothetical protein [Rubritepida sp.]